MEEVFVHKNCSSILKLLTCRNKMGRNYPIQWINLALRVSEAIMVSITVHNMNSTVSKAVWTSCWLDTKNVTLAMKCAPKTINENNG
ncbi:hypothetical protein CEXT_261281 [Caerostris extrusa]|uniref:Uncharacterized protein n=1 Tax=Caerostris extrusa TaxID=172846 RepID=A0AAV4U0D6_CAEEX|nr:hypothetical protein CEXT_261281 [Caerostris extrusa]